jgi:hypothetical protein
MPQYATSAEHHHPDLTDSRAVAAWLEARGWRPIGGRGRRSSWTSPDPADQTVYTRAAALMAARALEGMATYTFAHRRSGFVRSQSLALYFEVDGAALSDDYTPAEITPEGLWRTWADRAVDYSPPPPGPGWVGIYWAVRTHPPEWGSQVFEAAPFVPGWEGLGNFLEHFTWPEDQDGEPLNWLALPVLDGRWRKGNAPKGGFFQEATGWKPAPLTPYVHVPTLARAAGLYIPEAWR